LLNGLYNLEIREKVRYTDDGFQHIDHENDQTYVPENPDSLGSPPDGYDGSDSGSEGDDSDADATPHADNNNKRLCGLGNGRSNKQYTREWLNKLAKPPGAAIFSPRVAAIANLVKTIRSDFPHNKMMIVSSSLKFLDILRNALKRTARRSAIGIVEFSGTTDIMSRANTLRRFNVKPLIPSILLMTIGAGGAGLTIPGANRLIIGEPQRAPGTEEQATGRVYRMP
jgi:SNF2 family DNA or RNA helicase